MIVYQFNRITKGILMYSFFMLIILNIQVLSQTDFSKTPVGGEEFYLKQYFNCLTEIQRLEIIGENRKVISKLRNEKNEFTMVRDSSLNSNFEWPLKKSPLNSDYGYYCVPVFADHDPEFPDKLLDYYGGERTYDLETGYNHGGTDLSPWPFGWYVMDNDLIEIVSMAEGVVIGKVDGRYDRNCGWNNDSWNAVYVLHANGIVAWYGHLKRNSTTSKNTGDTVSTGEYLGLIGSSGSSSGPHLHLEVHDSLDNVLDPWEGPHNPSIDTSMWADQKPYYDSKVNKIATHSNWPVFPECPNQEILNLKNTFQVEDTVFLIVYYQDQLKDQVSFFQVTTPSNTTWWSWQHSSDYGHLSATYWGWYMILPGYAESGTWEFKVLFEGEEYIHNFEVEGPPVSSDDTEKIMRYALYANYPNPFNPSTKIRYSLASQSKINITIYNCNGEVVSNLVDSQKPAGNYEVEWNASNLASGIYYYKLTAGDFTDTKKMLLVK